MRTRNREDVHDARRRERNEQRRVDAVVAAEQHRKNCRRIMLRHDFLHARRIVLADGRDAAQELHRERRVFLRRHAHARFADGDGGRDALHAQQQLCIELAGILIAMRQTHLARCLDGIADRGVRHSLPFLRAAVDIEPACRRLRRSALLADGLRLDMVAELRLPRRVLGHTRFFDEAARDVDVLTGKGRDVICWQCVGCQEVQSAEHEEQQRERQECPAAPSEDEHG